MRISSKTVAAPATVSGKFVFKSHWSVLPKHSREGKNEHPSREPGDLPVSVALSACGEHGEADTRRGGRGVVASRPEYMELLQTIAVLNNGLS